MSVHTPHFSHFARRVSGIQRSKATFLKSRSS
jgi:hypothetical protein